jgi:hypothetical protein
MSALSTEQAMKIINDRMAGLEGENTRAQYLATKMYDLPLAYQTQMPKTTDTKVLETAEQAIRAQFRKDFGAIVTTAQIHKHLPDNLYEPEAMAAAAANAANPQMENSARTAQRMLGAPNVGVRAVGGGSPLASASRSSGTVDTTGMSGVAMIAAGLREDGPAPQRGGW